MAESELFASLSLGFEKIYGTVALAVPTLAFVIGVLFVAYIVIYLIQRVVKRLFAKVDFNPDIEYLIYRAIGWVSWFLVLIWLVGQLGQDEIFASLIAGGTLAGLAIALAVKDSLADVVGGILLLGDKHFDLHDKIKTNGIEGEIIEVDLRKTRIKTPDGAIHIVSNAKIDKGGWTLLPREKQKQELFTKLTKKASKLKGVSKRVLPLKK